MFGMTKSSTSPQRSFLGAARRPKRRKAVQTGTDTGIYRFTGRFFPRNGTAWQGIEDQGDKENENEDFPVGIL